VHWQLIVFLGLYYPITCRFIHYLKSEGGRGTKRKGGNYGSRKGHSLEGTYKRGPTTRFVAYHCKKAFEEGSACVDAVCHSCRFTADNENHSCPEYKQKIGDYKAETNQAYMPRKRHKWPGPGPIVCGICEIIM